MDTPLDWLVWSIVGCLVAWFFLAMAWAVYQDIRNLVRKRRKRRRGPWIENWYDDGHRAERAKYADVIRSNGGICMEKVCIKPSRRIEAGAFWHLGHDHERGGQRDYFGPVHPECNRYEAEQRGVVFVDDEYNDTYAAPDDRDLDTRESENLWAAPKPQVPNDASAARATQVPNIPWAAPATQVPNDPWAAPATQVPNDPWAAPATQVPNDPWAAPATQVPNDPWAAPATQVPNDPWAAPATQVPDKPSATPKTLTPKASRADDCMGLYFGCRPGHCNCPGVYDEELFEQLRAWRFLKAAEEGVPTYAVFTDRTLQLIAEQKPRSADALLRIHGIGKSKIERYSDAVLALID